MTTASPHPDPETTGTSEVPEAPATIEMPRESLLPSILDVNEDDLNFVVLQLGQPPFRARQLWRSLYHDGARSFDEMTTLAKPFRAALEERYRVSPITPEIELRSADGSTDKVLFKLQDGELIETVLMRYGLDGHRRARRTVCISTQAGCALGCKFCATGQQGFRRQLSPGEIVAQVLHMRGVIRGENAALVASGEAKKDEVTEITNVVFMGMGEPLANYNNTMQSIAVMNHGQGMNIGARHLTVSTVGLVPEIRKLAREPYQLNLAVSLHAPDDESRSRTMPVNKRYPIARLMHACRDYVETTNRRIFFEYVLLDRENDTPEHAKKLTVLLKGLMCHVNLIPVNPTENGPYARPNDKRSALFREILTKAGIPNTVRQEKGIDINAGCGQLRARALDDAVEPAE
ncbi:MAG TPA: 23S rRNA (adenine(2503)-C(2))-methyltransferase RlmN [Dehalococcoidia bacterium]|nr:23S rRNA (adenine(2503)-C(2))-methyltransferase RlmN [Dehalococcoidia bacterium]MDP6273755.1 23S rRNA (adenine(2503)-C(2))-methyltransferase RlmN [Dehalococcoidia bacterium]MDP7213309.1 23S rRNA (adenine(2503)-C(2))-methyltransferase RlmN [Dehalococcoidia bacterium]MDP7514012.1 23S rRNA (adenine(2503)-C(2))-methyltransferase RlmN [Dehalococcoidia bacterium]HJM54292.1 23S rRNA (adenine(2503)-C(2))-methyltransferase RlmN [Dehalococcoidia bacterium]